MAVSSLTVRWLVALSVLAIAVVLSACSDSPLPTPEPTAAATAAPSSEHALLWEFKMPDTGDFPMIAATIARGTPLA